MLGDDASMAFMELIKKILDILKSVSEGNRGTVKNKVPKTPKIKTGKLSKKDFILDSVCAKNKLSYAEVTAFIEAVTEKMSIPDAAEILGVKM